MIRLAQVGTLFRKMTGSVIRIQIYFGVINLQESFKTKNLAEKACLKYSESQRKTIELGDSDRELTARATASH